MSFSDGATASLSLWDRALGAYLGLAAGDALGATVEFMRPREIQQLYGTHRDIIGGGWLKLAPGQVTDDTTMSLVLGQALAEAGPQAVQQASSLQSPARSAELDALTRRIGQAFVGWWRSKPVDCGATCRRGIQRFIVQGTLAAPPNDGDGGNGALMRNLPVALATLGQPQAFEVLSLAQSHLTHHHPQSDTATLGLGVLTQALVLGQLDHSQCQAWMQQWARENQAFRYQPYPGRASGYVVDTVQTVLHSLHHATGAEEAIVTAVNQGDDADTTGALVGMLAGALWGASGLPERWLKRLQRDTVQAITVQTRQLLALADALAANPAPTPTPCKSSLEVCADAGAQTCQPG
jgi:ADP-ribosyl-[dinitrogen reductase] hydrolase